MPDAAAPPKKHSFFKKAAWQVAEKTEGEGTKDLFSHSSEFKDIVAEQQARLQKEKQEREEEERNKREAKRKKQKDEHERKRRKVSNELDEPTRLSGPETSGSRLTRASKEYVLLDRSLMSWTHSY